MYGLAYPVIDPYMASWSMESIYLRRGRRHRHVRGAMIGGFILGAVELW